MHASKRIIIIQYFWDLHLWVCSFFFYNFIQFLLNSSFPTLPDFQYHHYFFCVLLLNNIFESNCDELDIQTSSIFGQFSLCASSFISTRIDEVVEWKISQITVYWCTNKLCHIENYFWWIRLWILLFFKVFVFDKLNLIFLVID